MNKKSQSGSKAAMFVAIMMALIILYILFMPPAERERLLYNKTINETSGGTSSSENVTLILTHPGLLEYLPKTEYDKAIPSFSLYTKTEGTVIKKQDFITVKNNWLSTQTYEFLFSVPDMENTEDFILNFNVEKAKGEMVIEFNGKIVYDKEIKDANVVINLDKADIKEQNTLVFSASSVGIKFWSTNIFELSAVQIIAGVTDISKQSSKNIFIVSATEANNIDQSQLKFTIDCEKKTELEKLEVLINNHQIYSQLPLCGDRILQNFDQNLLLSGENTVEFRTKFAKPTTARYDIYNAAVNLKLKQSAYVNQTYYFDISTARFKNVKNGNKKIYLKILFTESLERKRADIFVNGVPAASIDTTNKDFSKDITGFAPDNLWVKENNNGIKIVQRTNLDIIDFKVTYE
jgi:hypothetical protein